VKFEPGETADEARLESLWSRSFARVPVGFRDVDDESRAGAASSDHGNAAHAGHDGDARRADDAGHAQHSAGANHAGSAGNAHNVGNAGDIGHAGNAG
jgi:hypothetical protein